MVGWFYKWLIVSLFCVNGPAVDVRPKGVGGHPFFISVTEVNHNSSDKTLEISCKIFIDDFEKVLTQKFKSVVSISSPKNKATLDQQISQYVTEHLSFKTDGKAVKFSYIGFEIEEDAVFCYFEVANVSSLKKLDVANTLLHDLNSNQINILHITVGGDRKSHKLDFPKSDASFSF